MIKRHIVRASDLHLVARAPAPDCPPLGVGDYCRLNSGGPAVLVVDMEGDGLVVSWRAGEHTISRACVRRVHGQG
jgi:hypothetical protein